MWWEAELHIFFPAVISFVGLFSLSSVHWVVWMTEMNKSSSLRHTLNPIRNLLHSVYSWQVSWQDNFCLFFVLFSQFSCQTKQINIKRLDFCIIQECPEERRVSNLLPKRLIGQKNINKELLLKILNNPEDYHDTCTMTSLYM